MPDIDEPLLGPSDKYGPLAAENSAQQDPALEMLGDFISKVINHVSGANFTNVMGFPAVREVFFEDPERSGFINTALPALFLWRSKISPSEFMAADWVVRSSTIRLRFVYPQMSQEQRSAFDKYINVFASALDIAIERGRHQAWIKEGDTDPTRARFGSALYEFLGAFRCEVGETRPGRLEIRMADAPPDPYDTIDSSIELMETIEYDLERYDENNGVDLTITTPTEDDPLPLTLDREIYD